MNRRSFVAVSLAAISGCASSNLPPTTQPSRTPDEQAYAVASQIVNGIKLSATVVLSLGVVNENVATQIRDGLAALDNAMAAWHGALNTSTSAELEAAVFAILPNITSLISRGKTNRAMMLKGKVSYEVPTPDSRFMATRLPTE